MAGTKRIGVSQHTRKRADDNDVRSDDDQHMCCEGEMGKVSRSQRKKQTEGKRENW